MVGCLGEAVDDLSGSARIQRCIGNDFLKEVHIHKIRAGEGKENASGAEQFEGEKVDVFIGSAAGGEVVQRGDELWWIEDDEIKLFSSVSETP
mgnify:CR=1 FL=1